MVKTPRTRHTKPHRPPVTIDLEAQSVSSAEDAAIQPDEIDVSVSGKPFEQMRDEPLVAQAEEQVETPLDDVVEDRVEAESATTGSAQSSSYSFEPSERESSARAEPASIKAEPSRQPSRASSLTAGLIGAVATLAGVMGLQWAGIVPTPNSGYAAPSLEPVQTEISALKNELAALKTKGGNSDAAGLDEVKSQIATLQSAVQSGGAGGDAAVAALDAKVKEIEAAVSASAGGAPAELSQKLTGLEGQVAAATEAVTKNDGRIAALEQSVSGLTGKVDQQASQPKVALAIAATALKSAVDRGGQFTAELETLAAISPEAPEIATLRPFAEKGIATEEDITGAMSDTADKMVAASSPVDENAGLLQRLVTSAQSMVKVRPVGEVAGEDPGARVARMEAAVKAGAYDKAIAEFDGLPDAVKAAGAPLADRIKARLEVTRLVDQLVAGAMKA